MSRGREKLRRKPADLSAFYVSVFMMLSWVLAFGIG
jgi:hypothetical protein